MKKNNYGKLSLLLMSAVLALSVNGANAAGPTIISDTQIKNNNVQNATMTDYNITESDAGGPILPPTQLGGGIYNVESTGNLSIGTESTGSVIFENIKAIVTVNNSQGDVITTERKGGVIYNTGNLYIGCELDGTPTGQQVVFKNNVGSRGGAITNGDMVGNSHVDGTAYIQNALFESNLAEHFEGDYGATATAGWDTANSALGGAIANFGILDIKGTTFLNNIADESGYGGAIYNGRGGNITINGNSLFQGNSAGNAGGAIFNNIGEESAFDAVTTVKNVTFDSNYAGSDGGAIVNQSISNQHEAILNIDGSRFTSNSATSGGAIRNTAQKLEDDINYAKATVNIDNGHFNENGYLKVDADTEITARNGGAIYNDAGVVSITGVHGKTEFVNNVASQKGGAIYNIKGDISIDNATFVGNGQNEPTTTTKTENGGAIYNAYSSEADYKSDITISNTTFASNKATQYGGAIYNAQNVTVKDSVFTNNTAVSGGAIYGAAGSTTTVIAENSNVEFSTEGSDTIGLGIGDGTTAAAVLNLNAHNQKVVNVQEVSATASTNAPDVNVNYNNNAYTGTVNFNSTVENVNLSVYNGLANIHDTVDGSTVSTLGGEIHFLNDQFFGTSETSNRNDLILAGGTFNVQNGVVSNIAMNSAHLFANTNLKVDVDIENQVMDNISTSNMTDPTSNTLTPGAYVNITDMNLINETSRESATIFFTDALPYNNVNSTNAVNGTINGKIYEYSVNKVMGSTVGMGEGNDDVYFQFTNTLRPSDDVTPTPIAQLGSFLLMDNIYRQSFANMDMITILTRDERENLKRYNRYSNMFDDEVNTFYRDKRQEDYPSAFVRAFTNLEHVQMKRGPRVSNVTYGTLIGHESGLYELGRGWDANYAVFGAYTGAHQTYNGIGVWQNGGAVGGVFTAYKGDFWAGLTANVGGWAVEATNSYGSEHFPILGTGVAMKTGYNWRLFDNKFIVQPSYMMSYSFLYAYSHDNAAGVHIKQDPLHAIEFVPGIKLIANNFRNGWQPYLAVNMTWMCIEGGRFFAEAAAFDSYTIRPFVEYGIGVQKHHGERSTGYLQAMVRNGGRTGVALTGGFRYAIGEDILD